MEKPVKKKVIVRKRREAREKGQPYINSRGKEIPAKQAPAEQASCSCKYECKNISNEQKQLLFLEFYKVDEESQGTYLLNHIQMLPIGRRRHGTYESPAESRRTCTFAYNIPDGTGKNVQVCKKTFKEIFSISERKLIVLQTKKKSGCLVFEDKRGKTPASNAHKFKFTEDDRNLVRYHINSFPKYESHYSRKKSSNEFLSPDLNKHRMYVAFKKQNPASAVTYSFYAEVLKQDFPNLKFKALAVDTCKKCDFLKAKLQSTTSEKAKQEVKTQQELHHRKWEKAHKCMKQDITSSQLPTATYTTLCMDLQQVMFVPMLTHSTMFYCRQLSCYNLGIHVGDNGSAYMCMWHEGIGGRGANEIASCLFKVASTEGHFPRKRLVLWCDNCGAQNKNQMLLMSIIYLVHKGFYRSIDVKYLVSGHSYMNCDRDFGVIEKKRKAAKAITPKDLEALVASAKLTTPFTVVSMNTDDFIDFKGLAKDYLNTKDLAISKISHFRISHKNPSTVKVASVLGLEGDVMVTWEKVDVLKKNANLDNVPDIHDLPKIHFKSKISREKKNDLLGMIDYIEKEEDKDFYRALLENEDEEACNMEV